MLGLLSALILLSGQPVTVEPGQALGACAWSRLVPASQQTVLGLYENSMNAAMNALYARDTALRAAAATCAGRNDLPRAWVQGAIASHVIQLGTADSLRTSRGLERARLDAVWDTAPAAARDCALHNASRAFNVQGPGCPDRRAPEAFLTLLDLSLTNRSTRTASEQVLIFMNARAQEQIAGDLIARMPPAAP